MASTIYIKRLTKVSKDTSKLTNMKNNMTGKTFFEVISNEVFIQHEIRCIYKLRPIFVKYTKADEVYKNLNRTNIATQRNGKIGVDSTEDDKSTC